MLPPVINEDLLINSKIFGTLTLPGKDGHYPCVLLLPGFASTKDEVAGIYVAFSLKLAAAGIASLRIDYPCCGKSPGNPADFDIIKALDGASEAVNFLLTHHSINKDKLGFCGFSMGAPIAMALTHITHHCGALVILSPAKDLYVDFTIALGEEIMKEGVKLQGDSVVSFDYPVNGIMTRLSYKKTFFDSLARMNVEDAITSYGSHLLIISGEKDFCHRNAEMYYITSPSAHKKLLSLPETDHILNIFSEEDSKAGVVSEEVQGFFRQALIAPASLSCCV